MKDNKALIAHLSMFGACAGWGLMAPVGKDAMTHGFDGITMVTFRVVGACLLFLIASLFAPKEHVPRKDKLMFIGAAIFGLLCNQCCYTVGLSITSPINASIVTTSMPIFAMILSALILKEPITGKKALGVLMGCSGALILILTSAAATSDKVGDIRGDLLCLFAQFSFALYLSLFNPLIRRYNVFTINKYMVGGGLCRMCRHILWIHLDNDWPAYVASYSRQRLQLRTARSLCSRHPTHGHRYSETHSRVGCRSRVQWCLAGNEIEVTKGYGRRS